MTASTVSLAAPAASAASETPAGFRANQGTAVSLDRPLRILQVHAFYQQAGGEDAVLAAERQLLSERGHFVAQYTAHNDEIQHMSGFVAASKTVWNTRTAPTLREHVARHAPDVIHAHNTFPLISPALYYAASALGVPVVQTLHNYRLLCPAAVFYRNGKVCEDCLHTNPFQGVKHSCYRNSRAATAAVAASIAAHRAIGTWRDKVDLFIALTDFGKAKFAEGGVPAHKILVKPNFLAADPGTGRGDGGYALFVGRLSPEKGIGTLLEAWKQFHIPLPLKIAGGGPLLAEIQQRAAGCSKVEVLGPCQHSQILQLMKAASVLVFPSEWYEGLPMTVIEAFACGTPVLASDLASFDELVIAGVNGARFQTGSAASLARSINAFLEKPESLRQMRPTARRSYESRFTAEANYPQLVTAYQTALRSKSV